MKKQQKKTQNPFHAVSTTDNYHPNSRLRRVTKPTLQPPPTKKGQIEQKKYTCFFKHKQAKKTVGPLFFWTNFHGLLFTLMMASQRVKIIDVVAFFSLHTMALSAAIIN